MDEIRSLKKKLEEHIKLGHLFSYKEFARENLLPESVIVENLDENLSSLTPASLETYERIMNEYLKKESVENSPEASELSLESK